MGASFIVSKARGYGDQLLVITGGHQITLASLDLGRRELIWTRDPHSSDPRAFALRFGAGSWMARRWDEASGLTKIVPVTSRAAASYWYDDNVQGPYNAVASFDDWEQKLNICGEGPYRPYFFDPVTGSGSSMYHGSKLIAYQWCGGAINELWRFWPATGVPGVGSRVLLTNFEFIVQLGARPDGSLYMHPNRDSWETWSIEDAGGGAVFLRSAHGTCLGSRGDGSVYVTTNRDAWERWILTTDDAVRLRSAQWGLNLGARPDGSIYTHANRLEWERWWATLV